MKVLIAVVVASPTCSVAIGKTTMTKGYIKKNGAALQDHARQDEELLHPRKCQSVDGQGGYETKEW